jgi:hypothetical protein
MADQQDAAGGAQAVEAPGNGLITDDANSCHGVGR